MAQPFAPYAGIEGAALTGGEGGDILQKLIMGIIGGTVAVPKNVIEAAAQTAPPGLRREDVTDIPPPSGTAAFGLSPQAWQPGDALRGQTLDAAVNTAGMSMPFAMSGAAGVFGGRLAKTADKAALNQAEEMAAAGADRHAIWDKTGWFKGSDGKWRFEIPDYNSQMNQKWYDNGLPNSDASLIAGQLWHKPLYDAYPDLRNITGLMEKEATSSGGYSPASIRASGEETINLKGPNAPGVRSVALHEMQHAIQEREGFARGGSPGMFTQGDDAKLARDAMSYRRELADIDPHLTPKQKDAIVRKRYADVGLPFPGKEARDVAHDVDGNPAETLEKVMQLYGTDKSLKGFKPQQLYRELPGEVEARNVQMRQDIPPEMLRSKPPWETEDMASREIVQKLFGGPRVGSLEGLGALNAPVFDPSLIKVKGK